MTSTCPVHHHPIPFDELFFADRYLTYDSLYRQGPVHRVCLPDGVPVWLVTRFEEAREVLRDPRLARNRRHAGEDWSSEVLPEMMRSGNVVTEDPPVHTRLRQFMNFAFTPRRVDALVPRIQEIVDSLLDRMAPAGHADLISDLAAPLSITVIADLLGVPPEGRPRLGAWTDALLGDDQEAITRGGQALMRYVAELIELKRREPADDLISHCVSATDPEGRRLSEPELLGTVFILIAGGFDTTLGTIGNGVLALLTHPEKAAELRANPDLMPAAAEEILRRDGALHTAVRRFATEDLEIGGVRIPAGDAVLVSVGAANRDPEHFDEPVDIRFDRADNRHLAFGIGTHHCVGAPLARLEIRIALETLLRRFPGLALAVPPEQLVWRRSYIVRVLRELPVTF